MQVNLVKFKQAQSLKFLNSDPSKQPKSEISKAEAEVLVHKISTASTTVFKCVVLLVDSRGYLAIGFNKVQDCLRKKVPELSTSYISRLLSAAETFIRLDASLTYLDRVSEATFRPLQNINDDDIIRVWKLAVELSDSKSVKRITSREIKRAIERLQVEVNVSKSHNIVIDLTVRRAVAKQATAIANFITPNAKSSEEYKFLCKLVYQHLLESCPVSAALTA